MFLIQEVMATASNYLVAVVVWVTLAGARAQSTGRAVQINRS